MIGRLTGIILEEEDGSLVLETGGVGYDVLCPLGTRGRAPTLSDGRQTLVIHTHVREDQFTLFGFADEADRGAFRQLISVSNVGPKIAIALLSAMSAGELGRAIAQKELAKLTAVSGVGKKTAERLLLELKDKLPTLGHGAHAAAGVQAAPMPAKKNELLVSALVKMGYRPQEVERMLPQLGDKLDAQTDLGSLIREALALLAK